MPGIGLEIDPVGEDAANVVLDLNDGSKFRAMEAKYPTPPRDVNWAESADTEGALPANLRYQNRQITITCRVYGSSASDLQTQLGYLEQKVGKINEEPGVGGTHEYVSPSGVTCIFDLLEASADYDLDNAALANRRAVVTITFTAKPFWRVGKANEVAGVDHVETTLSAVIGVDTALGGDVPALGRLVIDDDQGQDQWTALWGVQSRYYDASADAALFYEAESRTPQGGAATAVLAGSSGGGSNTVLQGALTTSYQSMLSTQAVGGGNHLRHVGTYRVFGRFQRPSTNTGSVSVCLEWGEGDLRRFTVNDAKTWAVDELEGVFTLADLGLVRLDRAVAGTQRWEGRVLAMSTKPGDDIYVDCLFLFPVDEGYGELKITPQFQAPTVFSARDEFNQTTGAATGKTLPIGGTWAGAGDPVDFNVATENLLQRVEVLDANQESGRYLISGVSAFAAQAVRVDVMRAGFEGAALGLQIGSLGALARYIDTSNWLTATLDHAPGSLGKVVVRKRVAGTTTILGTFNANQVSVGVYYSIALIVDGAGRWFVWFWPVGGSPGEPVLAGVDTALATGGALASGKPGIYDVERVDKPITRTYDNFAAWVPVGDAAVFASQSAEVRSDCALREDTGGTLWARRTDYKGSYFRPPPARREGRSVRTIVKLSRGNIDLMPDSAIDDASFRIFWQPRGLGLPES